SADSPQLECEDARQPQQPDQSTTAVAAAGRSIQNTQDKKETVLASDNALERLLQQQLQTMSQLMSQQLDVLRANYLSKESSLPSENYQPQSAHQSTGPTAHSLSTLQRNQNAEAKYSSEKIVKLESRQRILRPSLPPYRIEEIRSRELSPRKRRHLEELIARYTARTQKSKQITQAYRPVLAD